jgi:hypothetical protein
MSISLETAVGIVAAILATIPICISGYRCWQQRRVRRGCGTGKLPLIYLFKPHALSNLCGHEGGAQNNLLPTWQPPQNDHNGNVFDSGWDARLSHGHGYHREVIMRTLVSRALCQPLLLYIMAVYSSCPRFPRPSTDAV